MSRNGDLGAATMGVDLALDRLNILDCRKIERATPHEGPQNIEKGQACLCVPGDGPRLYHRRPFPVLADAFIIYFCR